MFVSTVSPTTLRPGMLADGLGQARGVGVVFGQPIDVVLQRVQGCGGQDAGLPHAAAEQLAVPPGLLHQVLGPGQRRADRGAQPLAEADAHGVEVLRPAVGRDAGGHDGVEQPCAVQVRPQAVGVGPIADRLHDFVRLDAARAAVVRVLQADQPRADQVLVVGRGSSPSIAPVAARRTGPRRSARPRR